MTRLRSDDPVSQAVASSFLAFLQNSVELTNEADAEALEVAIECLSSVFGSGQTQSSSLGHPDLLPQIFRLLLNQGLGQNLVSGQQGLGGLGHNPAGGQQSFGQNVDRGQHAANLEQQTGSGGALPTSVVTSAQNVDAPKSTEPLEGQTLQNARGPSVLGSGPPENAKKAPTGEPPSLRSEPAVVGSPPAAINGGGPSTPQRREGRGTQDSGELGTVGVSRSEENARADTVMKDAEETEDKRWKERGKEKEDSRPSGTSQSVGGSGSPQDKLRREADELKMQGNNAISAGRYYEALELYTQAISLVDDVAIYYSNRAAAHHQLGQYELAIKDCEQSIRLDPQYARAYSRLGLAYFEKGDCQTAIDRGFLKALELDPENTVVKQNLKAAQEKLARHSRRQQTSAQQPQPQTQAPPQQGASPTGNAQAFPQAPQNVQGLVNMAANLFTPLASMATGGGAFQNGGAQAAPGGHVPPNQGTAFGGFSSQGGQAPSNMGGGFQGFGAHAPSGGHVPFNQGAQQPGAAFPNVFGQNQGAGGVSFNIPGGSGAEQMQGGQQVQNLLTQMFQAFQGSASQQNGTQGGTQGPQRSSS